VKRPANCTTSRQQLSVSGLPLPPAGTEIQRVDIIVRICPDGVH